MKNKKEFMRLPFLLIGLFLFFAISCDKDDDNNGDSTNTFKDSRDGKVYKTVKIGNQIWMAENLAYAPSSGNYWAYDNDDANVGTYGYLYDWQTALNVCPTGWHLPSDDEWTELVDYLVAQGYPNEGDNPNGAGNALKSCRQVDSPLGGDCDTSVHPRWNSHSTHYGTDVFGFSALPGGFRDAHGFHLHGLLGLWWSATEYNADIAWSRSLRGDNSTVGRSLANKRLGVSVRCFRN